MAETFRVIQFQRKPLPGQNSVERLSEDIRRNLPPSVRCEARILPFQSRGVFRRFANILYCCAPRGSLRHITGDTSYAGLFGPSSKTLLTILDCVSLHRLKGWRRSVLKKMWYDLPIRHAQIVTVISNFVRDELLSLINCDAGKVRTVYLPVSNYFQPSARIRSNSPPVILQIGTGSNKNLERLALALEGISCQLNIIGDLAPQQRALLAEKRISYNSSANIGVEEVVRQYREADLVTFVSTYEGFGLPIVEANATGRPVITSNCSSMPEIAGDAACIVDPFDPQSIREGVTRILTSADYSRSLVEAGFVNAARFSAPKIAAEYASIYEELISSNP